MVVWDNAQLPPAIHHGEETEVVVLDPLCGLLAQAEAVQEFVFQQQLVIVGSLLVHVAEDSTSRRFDALPQFFLVSAKHELEQLGDRLGILLDLFLCRGVHNGKTGIDVPFVRVDAEHDVDLDILDTADVTGNLPWELVVRGPGASHAEKGCMCNGLGVSSDSVVCLCAELDMLRIEARKNILNQGEAFIRRSMLDQNQRLTLGVHSRAVQGMARYNFDVLGQMLFKRSNLRGLTRRLTTDNGTEFGRRTVSSNNGIDVSSFDTVDDVVTGSGDVMAAIENRDIFLLKPQQDYIETLHKTQAHTLSLKVSTNESYFSGRSHAWTLSGAISTMQDIT